MASNLIANSHNLHESTPRVSRLSQFGVNNVSNPVRVKEQVYQTIDGFAFDCHGCPQHDACRTKESMWQKYVIMSSTTTSTTSAKVAGVSSLV